jgi:hypothetical protein
VTAAVPRVVGVKVEVHDAEAPVPANVHVVNVPVTPVSDSVTVPVGVMNVPGEVSVTVTVQVSPWLMKAGPQLTVVVVVLRVTTIDEVPVLPLCALSPG